MIEWHWCGFLPLLQMPQNLVDRFPRNGANEVGTAWPQTISNNGILSPFLSSGSS